MWSRPRRRPHWRADVARAAAWALALLLGCALAAAAAGQEAAPPAPPVVEDAGTGDDWIDARLRDMDRYAERHHDAFADEIVRYLEAPRALVEELMAEAGMRPGEVYYACALARVSGRSCRTLVDAWRAATGGGWPAVVAQLELEGETRLHARIREQIAASYRRWARPLGDEAAGAR